MSKSTAQQIADLQNKLQALRTKKARQDRREETRQKIILGAEVAKVLDKKPEEINKALILGLTYRKLKNQSIPLSTPYAT
ncbi:Uncharacterised protein [Klebsiella pneumoniae]|uniref:conjugal transfer protein TraD n=1 Tax=Klebsiella pneumoniae TaxID=573 RepID=UPI000E2E3259|nr:conjugal transfer protein TraD [Klebsiella pneumoniae]SYO12750.1 Uncharacterised protein [Klebsiella pneumoniae]